jgi:hypothetical protein
VRYVLDDGPATLAVSPDGRRLYAHSYSTTPAGPGARQVSDWLQVVDANTGEIRPDTIPLPDCGTGQLDIARPSATLIVTCFRSGDIRLVDLVTNRVVGMLPILHPTDLAGGPEGLVGAALSSDGAWMDVVTNTVPSSQTFHIAVIDVDHRSIARCIDLTAPTAMKLPEGFVAF